MLNCTDHERRQNAKPNEVNVEKLVLEFPPASYQLPYTSLIIILTLNFNIELQDLFSSVLLSRPEHNLLLGYQLRVSPSEHRNTIYYPTSCSLKDVVQLKAVAAGTSVVLTG